MKGTLTRTLYTLAGYLPLPVTHWIGYAMGRLVWALDEKSRRYTLKNLELCFPELTDAERLSLGKASLVAMAHSMFEAPRLWRMSKHKLNTLVENPEWLDELGAAYSEGNGLIIAAPHLGSWEFLGQISGQHMKMTSLFRPPRMEELTDLIITGRAKAGASLVPTDASGVKALTRALKEGQATGILPDQEPSEGNGVFADFFGHTAYTMPLLVKLARKRRVPIFFVAAERKTHPKGYYFHVKKGGEELYDLPVEEACTAMNSAIETLIRRCPAQYNWAYRRFRRHPEGINRYSSDK